MNDKALIKILGDALIEAQTHLDYCGYGDRWEHECAVSSKIPQQIDAAVEAYKKRGD